jgi:hypothetical protein
VVVAPSTAYEIALDLAVEARPRVTVDVPACHVHVFDGDGVTTHRWDLGDRGQTIDLTASFGDWDETLATWRARAARLD